MSNRNTMRGRRSGPPASFVAFGILLIAFAGGALLLHASGVVEIPFLTGPKQAEAPPPMDMRGKDWVIVPSRDIPAYAAVTRTDIRDPAKKKPFAVVPVSKKALAADASILTDPQQILGRVLKRDKPAGLVFTERDFYPRGTRPGPSAGVPAGKRAMRLSSSAVPGLHGLQQGDRFDIVMTREVEIEEAPKGANRRAARMDAEGPYASMHEAERNRPEPVLPTIKRRYAEVEVVVENGLLVQPVHQRQEFTTVASGMLAQSKVKKKPVEELIIAVAPEEVTQLNRALAVGARLQVAIRSGQVTDEGSKPDDLDQGKIPGLTVDPSELVPASAEDTDEEPKGHYRLVEVIVGGKKQLISIPVEKEAGTADPDKKAGE